MTCIEKRPELLSEEMKKRTRERRRYFVDAQQRLNVDAKKMPEVYRDKKRGMHICDGYGNKPGYAGALVKCENKFQNAIHVLNLSMPTIEPCTKRTVAQAHAPDIDRGPGPKD